MPTSCMTTNKISGCAEAECPYCAHFVTQDVAPLFQNGISDLMLFSYVAWGNAINTTTARADHLQLPQVSIKRVLPCSFSPAETVWEVMTWLQAATSEVGHVLCQHGVLECQLDRVINCATDHYPDQNIWCGLAQPRQSAMC